MKGSSLHLALSVLIYILCYTTLSAKEKVHLVESQGRQIVVDVYQPETLATRAPAVLVLVGRSGMGFYKERITSVTSALVQHGLIAVVPRFLGRTEDDIPTTVTSEVFELWQSSINDLVTFTSTLDTVDPLQISVIGFSLGGFTAAVEAANDPRVKAMVVHSAGLSDYYPDVQCNYPPTLIIHSRKDPIVPVEQARALKRLLQSNGAHVEIRLYDSNEHVLSGIALERSIAETCKFLTEISKQD